MKKSAVRNRTRPCASHSTIDEADNATNDNARIAFEYRSIDTLSPPRRQLKKYSQRGLAALRASLRAVGVVRPILVDSSNRIVAGHGVWLAAKALGFTEVPIVRADHLSEAQITAYGIADNQIANTNPFDDDELRIAVAELNNLNLDGKLDFEMEITGFTTAEIDNILDQPDTEADCEPIESKAFAITRPGDIWTLGNHRLYCGDALEESSYVALLGAERADMAWADSPYNVPVKGHVSGLGRHVHREFAMASGEMTREAFTDFLTTVFRHLTAFSLDGSIHFQCMDWRHMREMLDAGYAAYAMLKNLCVWAKANSGMGTFYRSQHELIFVFKNGTAKHINNFSLGETGRHRSNLWQYAGANSFHRKRDEELAMHSTVKNLSMVSDAIRDCSHRGSLVLDPFGGSGTTLIAAENTGRRARLIEIDPSYCDVTIRRWCKLTGKNAVREGDGATFESLEAAARSHNEEDDHG